jgi:phage terminase small subunit
MGEEACVKSADMAKAPVKFSKLPAKRKKFCIEYLKTLNASEAARRAGYATRADVAGARLMVNASIREYISQKLNDAMASEKDSIKARIINLWSQVSSDSELNMRDRLKASELMAKYAGLLTDRVELTGKDGAPIQIQWPDGSHPTP